MPAFVAWLLSGSLPNWSPEQWQTLATARRSERSQKNQLELPATLDAALQVVTAEHLVQANKAADARQHAALAVEELPGNEQLLAWESALATVAAVEINPWEVAVQPDEAATADASEEQTASGEFEHHQTADEGDARGSDG